MKVKVTSVPFYIPDFNLLSCEWDNFTFKNKIRMLLQFFERNLKLFLSLIE